jgi:multiple sugar transport system permease protein
MFIAPAYLLFIGLVLVPVFAAVSLAFFRTDYITFQWVGLSNFEALANSTSFQSAVANTLFYVGVGVPVTVTVSLLVALLVQPLGPKAQSFFRGTFYLPAVAGSVVLAVVWTWILNPAFGLLNWIVEQFGVDPLPWLADAATARWAVLLVLLTHTVGQPIIVFLAGLASIPAELHDAARVDGAGPFQRAWHVTFPLLRPVILFVVAITTIGVFQIWETIYMLTAGGPGDASTSIVYELYETAFLTSNYGLASAMGVVLLTIVVAITFLQLHFWDVSYLE